MLTKADTQRLRSLREKKHREAAGLFVVEGEKVVGELLAAELPFVEVYATEAWRGRCTQRVTPEEMARISHYPTPSSVLALGRIVRAPLEAGALEHGLTLALDGVQDPGNVGTLLRSAAAFGFDGVLLSDGCASVFAPKTLRASMGAAVRVPVMEVGAMPATIAALRAKNITCLAAALYQSQPLSAARPGYPGGVCVVIGSEGQGLTEETIAACSGTVRIPMTDRVESLNAGIAGSILLWHFREESL